MGFTSLDDLVAGALAPADQWKRHEFTLPAPLSSMFHVGEDPGAWTTAGLSGEALTSAAGQIHVFTAAAGKTTRLMGMEIHTTKDGTFYLADRLWQNAIDPSLTTSQTVNSVAFPARDMDDSTNGRGVMIAMDLLGAIPTGACTVTVTYTNSAGTGSRTATLVIPSATTYVSSFFPIPLQAGDVGVRSIQDVTLSAVLATVGQVGMVAYRMLGMVGTRAWMDGARGYVDAFQLGMPKIANNAVLFGLKQATTLTTAGHLLTVFASQN